MASVAAHASIVGLGVARVQPAPGAQPAPTRAMLEFEHAEGVGTRVGPLRPGSAAATPDTAPAQGAPGGHRSPQNLSAEQPGARGDGRSSSQGRLLAARAEAVNLDPRLANARDVAQEQRIRTARDRASPQDDRRTPNPADDPWLATGDGVLLLRAPRATAMPAPGAALPSAGRPAGSVAPPPPTARIAARAASPAPPTVRGGPELPAGGVRDAAGARAAPRGPVATGRPALAQGHASTTADRAAARPRDDRDADLLALSLQRGATLASVQDGPRRAPGEGGVGGGGAPGVGGGEGRGGRAQAFGEGDGYVALGTDDARFVRYFAEVRRRLYPLWAEAFPRDEALRLRQGTVILHFVIARDGAVREVQVARRSGVDRFDQNVRAAVRGARLPPIPQSLDRAELRVRAPFEYRNPAVR
jgi:TonB family protein